MNLVKVNQFSPKFRILDSKKRFIGFRGGRGGGKSWGIIRWLVCTSCNYHMDIACCRAVWKNIEQSAYKLVVETIDRLGLSHQFKITDTYIINTITGSKFIFLGLNHNPAGIKSMEGYHVIFVEEGEQIIEDAWEKLIPTIVRKRGSKIICAWNPNLPTDPVESVYDMAKNDDCLVENINYLENPHCDQGLIDAANRMRDADPLKYQWVYLGMFQPEGSSTLISLTAVMNAIGRPPPITDPNTLIVGGLDLGFYQDRTALTVRHGHNLLFMKVWNHPETTALISELTALMNRWKIAKLGIDSLGPGAPIIDLMRAQYPQTKRIVPVAYSSASTSNEWHNLRAEAWGKIRDYLEDGNLPQGMDNDLISDFCNIRYFYDANGKIQMESKKSLVQRGFRSSDCFVGESLVSTPRGLIRIDSLNVGDTVNTPFGEKEIIYMHQGLSNTIQIASDINYIECTPDHKIFTFNRGWVSAENICAKDAIQRETNWLSKILLIVLTSHEGHSGFKAQVDTLLAEEESLINSLVSLFYTAVSMPRHLVRYLKDTISTTRTAIGEITASVTSNVLRHVSTRVNTCVNCLMIQSTEKTIGDSSKITEIRQKSGTVAQKVWNGIVSTLRSGLWNSLLLRTEYVNNALNHSRTENQQVSCTVPENVVKKPEGKNTQTLHRESIVQNSSVLRILVRIVIRKLAIHLLAEHAIVRSVKSPENVKVYCPTLKDTNALYVGGFLVANCADSLGISLIVDDKDVKVEKPHALRLRNEPTDWMSI